MDLRSLMSNITSPIQTASQPYLPTTSTGTTTGLTNSWTSLPFIRCPGLTRCTGRWWRPNDKDATEVTYCDYCKNKLNISGCVPYHAGARNLCNCDSYILSKNIVHKLFTVSFWSKDLKKHYPAYCTDPGEYTVKLPSNTKFNFLIDTTLPNKQYFKPEIVVGNQDVEFLSSIGNKDILFKHNLLVKGTVNNENSKDFLYVARGSMNDEEWSLIPAEGNSTINLKFDIYNEEVANHRDDCNKFLGNYSYNSRNGQLLVLQREKSDPELTLSRTYINSYNASIDNVPLDCRITIPKKYVKFTRQPIEFKIKIIPDGEKTDIDYRNSKLLHKLKTKHSKLLKNKIKRLQSLNLEIAEINKANQKNLESNETEILDLTSKLSEYLVEELSDPDSDDEVRESRSVPIPEPDHELSEPVDEGSLSFSSEEDEPEDEHEAQTSSVEIIFDITEDHSPRMEEVD